MAFSFFFDTLINYVEIKNAFNIICGDKLLYDGYIDMTAFVYCKKKDIKKEKLTNQLKVSDSKYYTLYKEAYAKSSNAVEKWNGFSSKCLNSNNASDVLSYDEAFAIVFWVYRCLASDEERIEFTKAYFKSIKEYHSIISNIVNEEGIFYNKVKIELRKLDSLEKIISTVNMLDLSNRCIFYRGQSNCNFSLVPSVMRTSNLLDNEDKLFKEMQINCPKEFESYSSNFEKLVKMQHYGLPTRLLDITRNLLVALFFACESNFENYGELILIEENEDKIKYPQSDIVHLVSSLSSLNKFEKKKLNDSLNFGDKTSISNHHIVNLFHAAKLDNTYAQMKFTIQDVKDSYIVYAYKNNERINKQDGAFILCGLDNKNGFLNKFRLKKDGKTLVLVIDKKKQILKELESFSINHATLFPEIDNVSEYLKKKYM